tara:strand:+ start:315 stop:641 length:327 start_codon:yes stop_codon:yes gene_type:complete
MSDPFDDFNRILKEDLLPFVVKYIKDPNNKIVDNLSDFLNDPKTLLKDIFEKFSRNKDTDHNQIKYTDIENMTDIDSAVDDEYDDLLRRLILIEENMMQMEKIFKDKK